jgi:hypothetical protein
MTSPKNTTTPQISQTVLTYYNAHYNNELYRAFRETLANHLPGGLNHPDHVHIMNLLTDVAFDRSGANGYQDSFAELGAALITFKDSSLFALAEQHLDRFEPAPDKSLLVAGLAHTANAIRAQAEAAVCLSSDYHDWRGRTAFWWLNAVAALSQAIYALLTGQHSTYIQEKLGSSLRFIRNGASESTIAGTVLNHPLVKWLVRFPLE